jgi:hypothetical protein
MAISGAWPDRGRFSEGAGDRPLFQADHRGRIMTVYKVLRFHIGDRDYRVGDTREAIPAEVAHLVECGVLQEVKMVAPPARKRSAKP